MQDFERRNKKSKNCAKRFFNYRFNITISTLYCITLLLCGCIFNVKVLQDTWNDLPNRQFLELKQLFPEIYDNKVHQPLKYEIV